MADNKTIADVISVKEKLKSPGVSISDCGDGILEPLVHYKWRLHFECSTGSFYLMPKVVNSVSRPTLDFEEIQTAVGDGKHVYTAGKHSWQPLTIEFTDEVDSSAMVQLLKQIQLQHEAFNGKPNDYKFAMHILLLEEFSIQEVWSVTGCFIQSTEYTSLDYPSDATETKMVIRFDHAMLL